MFKNENIIVDYAMRYGNPAIHSKLNQFKQKGCDRIIIFSLYPQYSGPTTATVNDEVCKWMVEQKWQPSIRIIPPYFDNPEYISSISKSISVFVVNINLQNYFNFALIVALLSIIYVIF